MDNKLNQIIENIIYLPVESRIKKDRSPYSILKASGYFELHDQIEENTISEVLQKHPDLVNNWLQWSEDKRTNTGWYFTKGDDGKCFVGHYPDGKEFEELKNSNIFYACSTFIKREIENIRIT